VRILIITAALLLSLQVQAGFWAFLESLAHKETWKEPVESTLIVGGIIVTGAAIAGAASNGSSSGSSSSYTGNCEYDNDIASDGTRCGARSAYSREGGWEP
jgi:hypothetical protein